VVEKKTPGDTQRKIGYGQHARLLHCRIHNRKRKALGVLGSTRNGPRDAGRLMK
jgi:hypothetical protein